MGRGTRGESAFLRTMSINAVNMRDAEAAVNDLCGNLVSLAALNPHEKTKFKFAGAMFRDVLVTRVATTNLSLTDRIGDVVTLLAHSKGQAKLTVDARPHEFCAPGLIAYGPGTRLCVDTPGGAADSVKIAPALLFRHAELLVGDALAPDALDMTSVRRPEFAGVAAEFTKQLNTVLVGALSANPTGHGALAASGYRELLLSFAAASLFPSVARLFVEPGPGCGSQIARQARDYIAEHAAEPVSLAELAENLGVSMRSLQQQFKQSYGLSPRDYLMERRMEIAQRLLTRAEQPVTVTDAAMAAGFSDLGRFAVKYRERYGHSPGDALRAARR
jgi:AraC-like DNA-binding protein